MLIFAAILAIFVYGMIAAMLGTILPDLSDRFKLTPTQNGTIAFAQALGLIIASVGVGPLLDTQGDKAGLILGLALYHITGRLEWIVFPAHTIGSTMDALTMRAGRGDSSGTSGAPASASRFHG